jgi:hypothetical protein
VPLKTWWSGTNGGLRQGDPVVDLTLRAGEPGRLIVIKGARSMGGWTAQMATEVVEKLIRDKASQTARYEVVWILAIDNMLIVDEGEIDAALRANPTVPGNWERLYLLPTVDRADVRETPAERPGRWQSSVARAPAADPQRMPGRWLRV